MLDYMLEGNKVLSAQPFSCMLGTKLTNMSKGYAEMTLPNRKDFSQSYGFVHGGVISYLADNCLTFAGASILGDCVTSEFKINYVMPSVGEKLLACATVLSYAVRQAVCECKIYMIKDSHKQLVAVAQGTIVKIETDPKL